MFVRPYDVIRPDETHLQAGELVDPLLLRLTAVVARVHEEAHAAHHHTGEHGHKVVDVGGAVPEAREENDHGQDGLDQREGLIARPTAATTRQSKRS